MRAAVAAAAVAVLWRQHVGMNGMQALWPLQHSSAFVKLCILPFRQHKPANMANKDEGCKDEAALLADMAQLRLEQVIKRLLLKY